MRKIINSPVGFVDEVVDGILLAHDNDLYAVTDDRRVLASTAAGTNGKVGIVTGGGSGHLPLFLGYVGRGLASGVAVGNIFSSPSAEQIFAATLASDDGAGVLYLYGNYGGDVYNFDIAAELAATRGVQTQTVLGTDDALSAPPERAATRRGVAGLFFAYKTAGAAAERGDDLATVAEIAQRTVDRTRTMGVGLSPTIIPATEEPTFTLDEGQMEIGIGIHGELGQHRGEIETADAITDRFLSVLLEELQLTGGDKVAVLVNGMGSTPLEELYLIYRRTHATLQDRGVTVHRKFVGEYATSLEMAGASLSIVHLDDELAELIDAPAYSPFFQQPAAQEGGAEQGSRYYHHAESSSGNPVRTVDAPGRLREVTLQVMQGMPAHADELRALDSALGDGDLGLTVASGAEAVRDAVATLPENAHASELIRTAGLAFASANPSTFAALFGGGLIAASQSVTEDEFSHDAFAGALQALLDNVQKRGGASVGDKTFVDVLAATLDVVQDSKGESTADVARHAAASATKVVDDSADAVSKHGRASWIGDRSRGQKDPGSVAVQRLIEEITAAI